MPLMTNSASTGTAPPPAQTRASWIPHLLIIALVWAAWAVLMQSGDRWQLFADYWFMSVTMALGSFVAGATSKGGGALIVIPQSPALLLFNILVVTIATLFFWSLSRYGNRCAGQLQTANSLPEMR